MPMLSDRAVRALRFGAARADQTGALTPEQVAVMEKHGWFRMLAPRHCGGLEMPFPEAVRLQEAISRADGSVGWVATLCAGAGWFGGFLEPELARSILATEQVCLAGTGVPSGTAEREGDSYRIDGRWDYATGADIATHFTFNARLLDGGEPLTDAGNEPVVKAFVVPAAEVEVIPDWRGMGLRATSTHSFAIRDLRVPTELSFTIDGACATTGGPLYQFPFLSLALATFAADISGMAQQFGELAREVIQVRQHPFRGCPIAEVPELRTGVETVATELERARAHFYRLLDSAWEQVCNGDAGRVDEEGLHQAVLALVAAARSLVDGLYPLCGLRAADTESDINRVWRDFHTAAQHALLLP